MEEIQFEEIQLYIESPNDELISTVNGRVRYDAWLTNECSRLLSLGRKPRIVKSGDSISLYVDKPFSIPKAAKALKTTSRVIMEMIENNQLDSYTMIDGTKWIYLRDLKSLQHRKINEIN